MKVMIIADVDKRTFRATFSVKKERLPINDTAIKIARWINL